MLMTMQAASTNADQRPGRRAGARSVARRALVLAVVAGAVVESGRVRKGKVP